MFNSDRMNPGDRKVLFCTTSTYILKIEGEALVHHSNGDFELKECGIVDIYDTMENKYVGTTFPIDHSDPVIIVRKNDRINRLICSFRNHSVEIDDTNYPEWAKTYHHDTFKQAFDRQLIEGKAKSNYTGVAVTYCRYNRKTEECEFKDGVRNGIYNLYWDWGKLNIKESGNYLDGMKDGTWHTWKTIKDISESVFKRGILMSVEANHTRILITDKSLEFIVCYDMREIHVITPNRYTIDEIKNHCFFRMNLYSWYIRTIDDVLNKMTDRLKTCDIKIFGSNNQLIRTYHTVDGIKEGDYTEYHENGELKCLKHYVKGKLEGKVNVWNENKILVKQENYVNNIRNGYKAWYDSGQIKETIGYQGTVRHGVSESWDDKGNLIKQGYYMLDKLNGMFKEWDANKVLIKSSKYIDGKLNGISRQWSETGALIAKERYVDGSLNGRSKKWYPDRTIKRNVIYRNGELHGLGKEWYDNGNPKICLNYVNGMREGRAMMYHRNGQKELEGEFKNNMQTGLYRMWHDNGTIKAEWYMKDAKMHGKVIMWHKNGNIQVAHNYVDGKKDGRCQTFDSNGKLTKDMIYKNGTADQ